MRWILVVVFVGVAIWLFMGGEDPQVPNPEFVEPPAPVNDAPKLIESPTLEPTPSIAPSPTPTPIPTTEPLAPPAKAPDPQAIDFMIYGVVKQSGSDDVVSPATVVGIRRYVNDGRMKSDRIPTESDGPGRFKLHVTSLDDVPILWELTEKNWRVTKWVRADDATKSYFYPSKEKLSRYDVTLWAYGAFWIRGALVDADRRPVEGAHVSFAIPMRAGKNLSMGSTRTKTDADGRFEAGPFPSDPGSVHPALKGSLVVRMLDLTFSKDGYTNTIVDPYSIAADQRERLEVVLSTGVTWSGILVDRGGAPLPNVVVEMSYRDQWTLRRATRTDADGRWRLDRLSAGKATLLARAYDHDAKALKDVEVGDSDNDLRLVADPLDIETPAEIVDVFGLRLVEVNAQIRDAFDVPKHVHVMIWNAGEHSNRLNVGSLHRGFGLSYVGDTHVKTLAHAIQLLNQSNQKANATKYPKYRGRVVYSFWNEDITGSNTQYLSLGPDDLAQLTRLESQFRTRYPKTPEK